MKSFTKFFCKLFGGCKSGGSCKCETKCPPLPKKHSYEFKTGLINSEWLAKNIQNVKILDCSWSPNKDHKPLFPTMRIPNAQFFDINICCDQRSTLPHMLPSPDLFNDYCSSLGLNTNDKIIIYDDTGLTAPRLWWTFRALSNQSEIAILDGGLLKWKKENREIENDSNKLPNKGNFIGTPRKEDYSVDINFVKERIKLCEQGKLLYSVIDARSNGRFKGQEPEPRPIPSGHLPFSKNLCFNELLFEENNYKLFKSPNDIYQLFKNVGVDVICNDPIIFSCGSGCTACSLAFGLHLIGRTNPGDYKVYDGSWSEWAENPEENKIITDK